jgi:hypothetical protein
MKIFIVSLGLLISTFSFAAYNTKIADCMLPATADEAQEQFQVFRNNSGDLNDVKNYSVRFITKELTHTFPAQRVQLDDAGKTLSLTFAHYIFLNIHDGDRSDNTSSVALGAPASAMTCHASL